MIRKIFNRWFTFILGLIFLGLDGYFIVPFIGDSVSRNSIIGGVAATVFAYSVMLISFLLMIASFKKIPRSVEIIMVGLAIPVALTVGGIVKISGILAKFVAAVFTISFSFGLSLLLFFVVVWYFPQMVDSFELFMILLATLGSVVSVLIGRKVHDLAREFFFNSELAEEEKMTIEQSAFWVTAVSLLAYVVIPFVEVIPLLSDEKGYLDAIKNASGILASGAALIVLWKSSYGKKQITMEEIKENMKQELLVELRSMVAEEAQKFNVSAEQVVAARQNKSNSNSNRTNINHGKTKKGNRHKGKRK